MISVRNIMSATLRLLGGCAKYRNMESFDYIIIGAGSAGSILANRLSANGQNTVALIEAGGSDAAIHVKMPAGFATPMNSRRFNWGFQSQPEPYLGGRIVPCNRGKGLGGSSSINGMVFVRGHREDFNEWEARGADGWNYQNCLPYFKKLERWKDGASDYRGGDGPVTVNGGNDMKFSPLYQAFIDAGIAAGYPACPDYNGATQTGFGPMQMSVDKGVRASTAHAYLRPILGRKNLFVFKKALTQKIIFEKRKAVGIEISRGSKKQTLKAKKEIILSAGAIGSPHLLQVSGIGPKEVLARAGIEPVLHLPGVGENLTDHLEVFFQYECKQPITLNGKLGLLSKAMIGIRWILFRTGLGATNHLESCGFVKSSEAKSWPDVQYHFLPGAISYDGKVTFKGHGYQVHVGPNKPASRGHVRAVSQDIKDHPEILFNYLKEDGDIEDWVNTIKITRDIMEQAPFDPYRGPEIQPGEHLTSDEDIADWLRQKVGTAYHPTSTCKMGAAHDPMAVVDPECRVIGIENLRVIDSSIFPTIPNGNLNAPTMMVAERAADIILENIRQG